MKEQSYMKFCDFDYYVENEQNFWDKFSAEEYTRLVQGKHREVVPMVSILLTTHKRVSYLALALESALNQKGFDDYQVIVVDNEAAPIDADTETSKFMKQYADNEKVVYYRNLKPAIFKMDTAASIARSKWICFLHDDDMLNENYLRVMTNVVKCYSKIKYLTTTGKNIDEYYGKSEWLKESQDENYSVYRWPQLLSGKGQGWLGALIDRACYISTGGMPTLETGIGDFVMTGKFHYKYGIYKLQRGSPLYLYRRWSKQTTALENWMHLYAVEYNYSIYDMKKYRKNFHEFWSRVCAYEVIEKCKRINALETYDIKENIDDLVKDSGMPPSINRKRIRYCTERFLGRAVNYMIRKCQGVTLPVSYK